MKRKKAKPVILDQYGQPYVAPPKPETVTITTASTNEPSGGYIMPLSLMGSIGSFTLSYGDHHNIATPNQKPLANAVAEQVAGLTADFDGEGHAELPAAPRDLETYRDAFASAAAKCQHDDAIELLYGREWVCDQCGRILNRDDMRRARASRGFWGLFG